jgi:hypothetical protein
MSFKNNNPGNIRPGQNFQGEIGSDNNFAIFKSIEYGYRAIFKDLITKIKSGTNTIEKIITKYAPPSENDTQNYIKNISVWTGIEKNVILKTDKEILIKLVSAISRQENGIPAIMNDVLKGYELLKVK